jgi:hypothetical protein
MKATDLCSTTTLLLLHLHQKLLHRERSVSVLVGVFTLPFAIKRWLFGSAIQQPCPTRPNHTPTRQMSTSRSPPTPTPTPYVSVANQCSSPVHGCARLLGPDAGAELEGSRAALEYGLKQNTKQLILLSALHTVTASTCAQEHCFCAVATGDGTRTRRQGSRVGRV